MSIHKKVNEDRILGFGVIIARTAVQRTGDLCHEQSSGAHTNSEDAIEKLETLASGSFNCFFPIVPKQHEPGSIRLYRACCPGGFHAAGHVERVDEHERL